MNCPTCGAMILDGASYCGRCGLQVGIPPFKSTQLRSQPPKDNKVLWIVAIVVIVVVVVPIVLSAVLYFMVLGFGGTSTQTPFSVLTKSAVAGGYKFTFGPVTKDTPWGDARILLSDQSGTAAWSPTTADLDGGIAALWVGGSQTLGTLNVFDNITDIQGNGFVNQGDSFTLTLGTGQVFSSSTIYTVTVLHNPTGAEICHIIFQGDAETAPVSSLTKSTITYGFRFTLGPTTRDTPWSDVTVLLTDGLNTIAWSPMTTDLDNGTIATWNRIAAVANLGTLSVNLSIVDLTGNGIVNQGDYFALTLGPGQTFSAATNYSTTVIFEPLGVEICHTNFQGEALTTPTMALTKSTISTGLKFTVVGITIDTQWGDVQLLLQNGTSTVSWRLTTAGLTGAAGKTYNGAAQAIGGGRNVYLNVTDLVGNGYVNGGDYITLGPGTSFSSASAYTLTLVYVPTGSEMTHMTFTG
jgi:hypothetical protein